MIRKRGTGLQVQLYVGRGPLTGRKRYVSQQVPGQTKASMREAKQIEARQLEEIGTGQHKGSRSRTMAELLERWLAAAPASSSPTTRAASASTAPGPASRPPTAPANATAAASQRHSAGHQRTGRQDQRHQRAGSQRPGADQRRNQRQDQRDHRRDQRRPPPYGANGQRPGATGGDDLARIRRIIAALLRRPPPPATRTRRPPAGTRPRPCASSTASNR